MTDIITAEQAYTVDLDWENAGMPDDGLRCVTHRRAGNGSVTLLCVPGNDAAPCYQAVNGRFKHVSGPTLAEWQAQALEAALAVDAEALEALYRDERDTREDLLAGLHW